MLGPTPFERRNSFWKRGFFTSLLFHSLLFCSATTLLARGLPGPGGGDQKVTWITMPSGQSLESTDTPQVTSQSQVVPVVERKKPEVVNISERKQPKIIKAPTPDESLPRAALNPSAALAKGNGSGQAGFGDNGGGGILPVGLIPAAVERSVKPPYPTMARKLGFEGRTRLQLAIDQQGLVSNATIVQSSGRSDVDHAARQTLRDEWRFRPALFFGHPIASSTDVVVVFSLRD